DCIETKRKRKKKYEVSKHIDGIEVGARFPVCQARRAVHAGQVSARRGSHDQPGEHSAVDPSGPNERGTETNRQLDGDGDAHASPQAPPFLTLVTYFEDGNLLQESSGTTLRSTGRGTWKRGGVWKRGGSVPGSVPQNSRLGL